MIICFYFVKSSSPSNSPNESYTLATQWGKYYHENGDFIVMHVFFDFSAWVNEEAKTKSNKVPCHSLYADTLFDWNVILLRFFSNSRKRTEFNRSETKKCDQKKTDSFHSPVEFCVHTPFFGTRVNQTIMLKLNESIFLNCYCCCFGTLFTCMCVCVVVKRHKSTKYMLKHIHIQTHAI